MSCLLVDSYVAIGREILLLSFVFHKSEDRRVDTKILFPISPADCMEIARFPPFSELDLSVHIFYADSRVTDFRGFESRRFKLSVLLPISSLDWM